MTEPIRPVGRSEPTTPPVPAVRRLTLDERQQAARERARKGRRRGPAGTSSPGPAERPSEGGSLDLLA